MFAASFAPSTTVVAASLVASAAVFAASTVASFMSLPASAAFLHPVANNVPATITDKITFFIFLFLD